MAVNRKQFELDRRKAELRYGLNRRDFLRATVAAPAVAGATYFGYHALVKGFAVKTAVVGLGKQARENLIPACSGDYIDLVAACELRPSQIEAAKPSLAAKIGAQKLNDSFFRDWQSILQDPAIEAVIVATPTVNHPRFVIEAIGAGKHVFCEPLLAANITDAKAIVSFAEKSDRIFAVGHQRCYNARYEDASRQYRSGILGTVKFINAHWHQNFSQVNPWNQALAKEDDTPEVSAAIKAAGFEKTSDLVNWNLFERLGGGAAAQLGIHQFDVFRMLLKDSNGKPMIPIAISGMGAITRSEFGGDSPDHVYATLEYGEGKNRVVAMVSSITSNGFEGLGETILGNRGTLSIQNEQDLQFYVEPDPLARWRNADKKIDVVVTTAKKGEATMYSAGSTSYSTQAASGSIGWVSPGFQEELEHFAFCCRTPGAVPRCSGRDALYNTVLAAVTSEAMTSKRKIQVRPEWFDPSSREVPDTPPDDKSWARQADLA